MSSSRKVKFKEKIISKLNNEYGFPITPDDLNESWHAHNKESKNNKGLKRDMLGVRCGCSIFSGKRNTKTLNLFV